MTRNKVNFRLGALKKDPIVSKLMDMAPFRTVLWSETCGLVCPPIAAASLLYKDGPPESEDLKCLLEGVSRVHWAKRAFLLLAHYRDARDAARIIIMDAFAALDEGGYDD